MSNVYINIKSLSPKTCRCINIGRHPGKIDDFEEVCYVVAVAVMHEMLHKKLSDKDEVKVKVQKDVAIININNQFIYYGTFAIL